MPRSYEESKTRPQTPFETYFPHPAATDSPRVPHHSKSSRHHDDFESKFYRASQPIRPHQYYDGERPSIIYVDEPLHVDTVEKKKHPKKSFIALAALKIVLGIIAIISQVVVMTTTFYDGFWPTFYEVRFLDFLGTGLWCGIFFVISGAIGLFAGFKGTKCGILSFLVTSIFSSLMCIPLICTSLLGTLITPRGTIHLGIFILQIVVSLATAAMSIAAAVLSCGNICYKQNNPIEPAVLYKATGPLPNYWPKY